MLVEDMEFCKIFFKDCVFSILKYNGNMIEKRLRTFGNLKGNNNKIKNNKTMMGACLKYIMDLVN